MLEIISDCLTLLLVLRKEILKEFRACGGGRYRYVDRKF